MSNFQNLLVTTTQSSPSNLTGCMYQIVQSPGTPGKNVLQLIPVSNAKDNSVPAVSSPVMTNAQLLKVQQPVRLSLPSGVSNVALPCPVNAQLVQQLGSANYIITTQNNPADASKTIRVDNKLSPVILRKPQVKLPSNSQAGTPSFIIMNANSASVPVKTIPIFPSSHGLQIPSNAEVKTVPASSLPLSIQQRIVPQSTSNDATKIPSLIYVSPVNTVKTSPSSSKPNSSTVTTATQSSPITSILVPAVQSSTTTPSNGPLKWVVQENMESKACIVPVKSTNETASKILALMSGAKTEDLNSTSSNSSNIAKLKDNALVMCNNKIYFLTKGADLKSPIHIKQEAPDKPPLLTEQGKDLANKVVEVVLSKNNISTSNSKQTLDSGSSPLVHPDSATPAKSKTCTPSQVSKTIPEVIYIDDDDDDEDIVQKAPSHHQPTEINSTKVHTPSASLGSHNSNNQVKDKETEMPKIKISAVSSVIDDQTLRAKFGLSKQEKIILNRIPLLRPEGRSDSRESTKDMMVHSESREKRKSAFSETSHIFKQMKKSEEKDDPSGGYYKPSSSTTINAPAGWSDVKGTASGERTSTSLTSNETGTNPDYRNASTSQSDHYSGPEMYADPSDSHSFYTSQDISGHFSEAPLPRQRFHIESSAYADETTKDEKIQRLKEVLKEREQALEALRRQKWS